MDCRPPGSSTHGISQARILEWLAISFSVGSSPPRGGTLISCIGRRVLYHWATREAHIYSTWLIIKSEKAMATHSSTLAWKISWMEEPGRLQSMGALRVWHDRATSFSLFTFMHWRRKWQPTPVFLPRKSQGQKSLVGCRLWSHRVGQDWSDLAAAAA